MRDAPSIVVATVALYRVMAGALYRVMAGALYRVMAGALYRVMAGLDPAICCGTGANRDGRVKPGHDEER